jgi:hypothetical protein
MGPLPRRALAAVAAVAVVAGGGWLFLPSRDAPPTARLRPGAGAVTGAEVTVDMARLRTDVEPRDGRMREEGLETDRFPTAGFRLREPVPLGDDSGARVVELRLPGDLTLHGVTRRLDFPVRAPWDGDSIQVAGGARIRRADFDLEVPTLAGYRIEDTAVVELELTLVRRGAALAGPVSTLRRATAAPQPGGEEPGRPQAEPCRGGGRLPEGGGRLLFSAITDDDTEHLFTVGADGRRIAYVRDGNLFVTRPDGSGACLRTGMLLTSDARWRPGP